MQIDDTPLFCRCGCGVPAHGDTGFPRGHLVCVGTEIQRFRARIERTSECWLWTGRIKAPDSYGRFQVDGGDVVRAHRFAWMVATKLPIPEGFDVLHTCDIRRCVRNDETGTYTVNGLVRPRRGHLWLGTHQDNMADKKAKDRNHRGGAGEHQARGARSGRAKLTRDDAVEILRLHAGGLSLRKIAAILNVSKKPIQDVVHGRHWTVVQ